MAGEYVELPEELVQEIQSFLDPKQAAHTSVLSNLWYSAWSTRPILCLDYRNFYSTEKRFAEFQNSARTSINRYQKRNLKPNTFKLIMYMRHDDDYDEFTKLVNELILSALTLGVNDLYVDIYLARYTLPYQVFSSICLKKLYIEDAIINLPQSNGKFRVLCSRLVSLELVLVSVNDDMMRDILLGCPLLEHLRVIACRGLKKINLSAVRRTLRTFCADNEIGKVLVEWVENNAPALQQQFHNLISLELIYFDVDDMFLEYFSHRFPCLERFKLGECPWSVTNIDIASNSLKYLSFDSIYGLMFAKDQVPNVQHQYHNLISLKLKEVEVDGLFFKFFSHRFPCVERLELKKCSGDVINIDIASSSLRHLTLIKIYGSSVIKVQAPNIQNFRLVTKGIPSLSFLPTFDEWKSDLTINQPDVSDVFWWLEIKDILRKLSPSKISLKISLQISLKEVGSHLSQSNLIPRISPFVENLEIEIQGHLIWSYWLLFCQPEYITWIDWFNEKASYEVLALAYDELKKHGKTILTNALPCIYGLEEVDMEHYVERLSQWLPVRQEAKEPAHEGGKFRLRLKWPKKRLRNVPWRKHWIYYMEEFMRSEYDFHC